MIGSAPQRSTDSAARVLRATTSARAPPLAAYLEDTAHPRVAALRPWPVGLRQGRISEGPEGNLRPSARGIKGPGDPGAAFRGTKNHRRPQPAAIVRPL